MLPLKFFFEPVLSVFSFTPTVFTTKISFALKAIQQCSHRRTDFGQNFGLSDEPVDIFQAGLSLNLRMRHPDCWLIKYFGEEKITAFKSSKSTVPKKLLTFAFKTLRFAEYWQLKPCWCKKRLKRKTLHRMGNVNKKMIKTRWSSLASGTLSCLLSYLCCQKKTLSLLPEKETNNSKIVAFFSKLHETR